MVRNMRMITRRMRPPNVSLALFVALLALGTGALLGGDKAIAAGLNSLRTPDPAYSGNSPKSIVLDSSGNPVISYLDPINLWLKILHCNDPNCNPTPGSPGNGPESIRVPDGTPNGDWSSLALDSAGNPVVAYGGGTLKILHCNDANCDPTPGSPGNGPESITLPVGAFASGLFLSLKLDSSGFPVVSYGGLGDLVILHCNDANCDPTPGSPGNGPESVEVADSGNVGFDTSLALDSSGFPVVSYWDQGLNYDLKLLHCNDANCAPGGDSKTSPDTADHVGTGSSLALRAGFPVISYFDNTNFALKVMSCNDVNCSPFVDGPETPNTVASTLISSTSLALDGSGNPVVSYQSGGPYPEVLKVLHCDDPACSLGGDTIATPDSAGQSSSSLVLDGAGRPVVSYYGAGGKIKVLHCGNTTCQDDADPTPLGPAVVSLGSTVTVFYSNVTLAGTTTLATSKSNDPPPTGFSLGNPPVYYQISTTASFAGTAVVCIDYGGLAFTGPPSLMHYESGSWVPITTSIDLSIPRICGSVTSFSPFSVMELTPGQDYESDGCANEKEYGSDPRLGGQRDPFSFWDYGDMPAPTRDKKIRINDVSAVIQRYRANETATINRNSDPLSVPPPAPAYHPAYDRGGQIGSHPWDVAAPNGQIRIDDVSFVIQQYRHDCA